MPKINRQSTGMPATAAQSRLAMGDPAPTDAQVENRRAAVAVYGEATAAERIRAARLRRQRARAEADRVAEIVARREHATVNRLMRENRAGGF